MDRRRFLQSAVLPLLLPPARSAEELKRFKISSITGFKHRAPRPKLVGKNSHLDNHGLYTSDNVLRIATDQGVEGFGSGSVVPGLAAKLVGQSLDAFWKSGIGVVSPLGRSDHALYDLIGKALGIPAWQ